MSTGQWRALALLGFLLLLEIIRSPTLQAFFKGILTQNVQGQISGGQVTSKPTGSISGAGGQGYPPNQY